MTKALPEAISLLLLLIGITLIPDAICAPSFVSTYFIIILSYSSEIFPYLLTS